jgi:pyrimidine deaminase RibD-like protein
MKTDLPPRQLAVDLLGRSTCKVQMAAVLTDRNGRIFSWGWNSGYRHAEEMAIARANPKRLAGATITVAGRRMKNGNSVYAKPCANRCATLIRTRGIRKLDFRAFDAWIQESLR